MISDSHWTGSVDKVSLIVTLLLGLSGWCLVQAVDRTTSAPLVEVKVSHLAEAELAGCVSELDTNLPSTIWEYRVRNISQSTMLKKVRFIVAKAKGQEHEPDFIQGVAIEPEAPALFGHASCSSTQANFDIPEFQPGHVFLLRVRLETTSETPPSLCIAQSGGQAVRVQNSGFRTWLVRNELLLLMIIAVTGIVVALILIITLLRS